MFLIIKLNSQKSVHNLMKNQILMEESGFGSPVLKGRLLEDISCKMEKDLEGVILGDLVSAESRC